MNGARALLMIIDRSREPAYRQILEQNGIPAILSSPAEGTAGKNILALLGLELTPKTLLLSFAPRKKAEQILRDAVSLLGINLPGNGIALSAPLSSIGGRNSLQTLLGTRSTEETEAKPMDSKPEFPYDLIMAIVQRGMSEPVMAAAKTVGAGGGTIVHAKGTGFDETFFNISIAQEKELLLIAIRHEQRDAVMHAIMEQAGYHSPSHTVLLTVPVEAVAGLRSIMFDESESKD